MRLIRTHANFRLLFFARESEKRGAGCDGLRRVLADCQPAANDEEAGEEEAEAGEGHAGNRLLKFHKRIRNSATSDAELTNLPLEGSTLAEHLMTAAGVMPSDIDKYDVNSMSSASSRHLPQGKLRWVYAQLELCMRSKEEPPAWLLQLVLRDVDHNDAQFERVSDFQS